MNRTTDLSSYSHYEPHEYVNRSHPWNRVYMNMLETLKDVVIKTK